MHARGLLGELGRYEEACERKGEMGGGDRAGVRLSSHWSVSGRISRTLYLHCPKSQLAFSRRRGFKKRTILLQRQQNPPHPKPLSCLP